MKKKLTIFGGSAAVAAATLAVIIAPSAAAAGNIPGCTSAGGLTTHCRTGGSSQVYTAPNPYIGANGANQAGVYGPFFNQNRGLGGAAAIGAAAGRGR